jgi:hypothetical protein
MTKEKLLTGARRYLAQAPYWSFGILGISLLLLSRGAAPMVFLKWTPVIGTLCFFTLVTGWRTRNTSVILLASMAMIGPTYLLGHHYLSQHHAFSDSSPGFEFQASLMSLAFTSLLIWLFRFWITKFCRLDTVA